MGVLTCFPYFLYSLIDVNHIKWPFFTNKMALLIPDLVTLHEDVLLINCKALI